MSDITSSGNPKEVKLKDAISSSILDLPNETKAKIDEAIKNNYFDHNSKVDNEDGLPF